jgi:hypothetical protein
MSGFWLDCDCGLSGGVLALLRSGQRFLVVVGWIVRHADARVALEPPARKTKRETL